MPVSAPQHRVTTGTHQNKIFENKRKNNMTHTSVINRDSQHVQLNQHDFPLALTHVGNSPDIMSGPAEQLTLRQSTALLGLQLLSQIRPGDNPLSAASGNSVLDYGREVLPSFSRNAPHSDNSGNGFSTMLSPVASALYETGQFIARHDPLKFPVADASPLADTESTTAASAARNLKGDSYIITDEQKKNELISSLVQYLVSDEQMTVDEGKDVELWLRSEAAGMPIVAARLDNEEVDTNRTKRALAAENDPRTAEHIKEHCAFEEEVLDAQGENQGKLLLFQAQRAENPFRMIYDNNPNRKPTRYERNRGAFWNLATDILSVGTKPLIGKLIANAKRREYYQNQGDKICAERFRRLFIVEVVTSLDASGLSSPHRGSVGKVKPSELLHALPEQERAAFYTRNPLSGIRKEILLELKQGKGAINDSGTKIYLKPTKKENEFVTYFPHVSKPELLERRVIVDENNLSWRYADSFDSSGLNVEISEGKWQIRLHGEDYELHQNGAGKYEIVVNKASGNKEFVPVYMEPLSRTWHLSTHNEHPVFSKNQAEIIKKIKVKEDDDFYYIPRGNNNKEYYGNGKIYHQELKSGIDGHYVWGRYVEMNGELVPVRNVEHQGKGVLYEVYDLKRPEIQGHPIEWDGNRWLFERKTSVHVSESLENLISPEMIAEKVDAGKLSAPDHQGLRYDTEGNGYIKIDCQFVKINQHGQLYSIEKNNGGNIYVDYKNNEFVVRKNKVKDKFDARKLANIDVSKIGMHSVIDHKNMYVTDNGYLYIKLNNEYYPVEFMGRDRKVILIGSPNETRFACIYNKADGSINNIDAHLGQRILTYNSDIDVYISKDINAKSARVMKFDKNKSNLANTNAVSVKGINKHLNKIEFENFDLYIPKKSSRDFYLAAHAGLDINVSSQIPENIELKFYTEKGKTLNGHVDDLKDLVNGKFNVVQTKKGGERVEAYTLSFDHDSHINYANLASESNKKIIKVKESGEVTLKNLLLDISSLFAEVSTLHLYMCRSF